MRTARYFLIPLLGLATILLLGGLFPHGAGDDAPISGGRDMEAAALPEDLQIVLIKRAWPSESKAKGKDILRELGFPSNHECQSSMAREIYENEIGIYTPSSGEYRTLYKPEGKRFVGHLDLHWDAKRLLFTQSDGVSWKIYEIRTDGSGLRRVSQTPDDVDCFDACYLPNGNIVFSSNAPWQCVPCWHGTEKKFIANLYVMDSRGEHMRRLTFDQDHDMHPSVRHSGQIIYNRWDYTGINRLFLRPLMVMNPDGSSQRAVYGSNSWFPNGLYYPKELPGQAGKFLCVLAGYHGSFRSGVLAIVDLDQGTREDEGIVKQMTGKGIPMKVEIRDAFTVRHWPEFLTPTPLTDELFLTSMWKEEGDRRIGIYQIGPDDRPREILLGENTAFLEPIPLLERDIPPVIPERIDTAGTQATVFIQDVHAGPGLKDVPRGHIKEIRVLAYDFGYIGLAGADKIGASGPWDAMRILGTARVEEDGSAMFRIPANTPLAFQALDEKGRAVQLMRSWATAMPGETMSCIGCHEDRETVVLPRASLASMRNPESLKKWYGPARGFDFAREVQPVLNRYCISCHDQEHRIDLRPEEDVDLYIGRYPGRYDYMRMHPVHKDSFENRVLYTPAYEALIPYIRRVNVGDDVSLLDPGFYHAGTSELVQILEEGHHGIRLDEESWSRISTWIDLNGPCHGTWTDVYNMPVPGDPEKRRRELSALYGGPTVNPELIPQTDPYDETPLVFESPNVFESPPATKVLKESPPGPAPELAYRQVELGPGSQIELVNFGESYWMSACEISNEQFRLFDPDHHSHYYTKRHEERGDSKGMSLNSGDQPVVRISWDQAMAFCQWLSEKSGLEVSLPTEAQWEYACRAGSPGDFHYPGGDFSTWENMADSCFATHGYKGLSIHGHFQVALDVDLICAEGVDLADRNYNDGGCVSMPVGTYRPNAFGLYDMHGNVAEWTRDEQGEANRILKGGSFLDRPERCSAGQRHAYPHWQKVYNAGFRIVVSDPLPLVQH